MQRGVYLLCSYLMPATRSLAEFRRRSSSAFQYNSCSTCCCNAFSDPNVSEQLGIKHANFASFLARLDEVRDDCCFVVDARLLLGALEPVDEVNADVDVDADVELAAGVEDALVGREELVALALSVEEEEVAAATARGGSRLCHF